MTHKRSNKSELIISFSADNKSTKRAEGYISKKLRENKSNGSYKI